MGTTGWGTRGLQHPPLSCHLNLQAGAQPNTVSMCSGVCVSLVPGSSPKSRAESWWFAREKAESKGRKHHLVIACKLNSASKWELQCQALNRAVSCAWCSCCSLYIPSDTGEGMMTERVKFTLQSCYLSGLACICCTAGGK